MRLSADSGDRRLMGPVSGLLWLAGAATAAVGWLLPAAPHAHPGAYWALTAVTVLYGVACLREWIPWRRAPIGAHVIAVLSLQPAIVAALWLTGGVDSFMGPVLVLPMLYVAYFFPPRLAWPLAAVEVATYASPLLYARGAETHLLLARTLGYAIAYAGLTFTVQFLKRRLVEAERHQRRMANQDPLTGLANRRAFDEALTRCLAAAQPAHARRVGDPEAGRFAVLLVDLDGFKGINDTFGHLTGDRVLRELAAHAGAEARTGDTLARIGGDELALLAPGAGLAAARRLADALHDAAARVSPAPDAPPISLTVSWAVFPEDGTDRFALLGAADRELHASKRERQAAAR